MRATDCQHAKNERIETINEGGTNGKLWVRWSILAADDDGDDDDDALLGVKFTCQSPPASQPLRRSGHL